MPGTPAQIQKVQVTVPVVGGIAFVQSTYLDSATGNVNTVGGELDLFSHTLFDDYNDFLEANSVTPTNLPEATP
jgi:hypothetical protein